MHKQLNFTKQNIIKKQKTINLYATIYSQFSDVKSNHSNKNGLKRLCRINLI
ncbi:hypothetical protein DET65_4026 [Sunxiuqinia elliptica]|nr:hypothetical protein DET65_4026 [Sunxiuqinia elliptica]